MIKRLWVPFPTVTLSSNSCWQVVYTRVVWDVRWLNCEFQTLLYWNIQKETEEVSVRRTIELLVHLRHCSITNLRSIMSLYLWPSSITWYQPNGCDALWWKVNTGLAESNGLLPPDIWLHQLQTGCLETLRSWTEYGTIYLTIDYDITSYPF